MGPSETSHSEKSPEYRLKVRSKAVLDQSRIAQWYEAQCPGIGENILLCAEAEISKVSRHPFIFRKIYGEYRRILIKRYHLGIFYVIQNDLVSVIAAEDLRKKASSIQKSLK